MPWRGAVAANPAHAIDTLLSGHEPPLARIEWRQEATHERVMALIDLEQASADTVAIEFGKLLANASQGDPPRLYSLRIVKRPLHDPMRARQLLGAEIGLHVLCAIRNAPVAGAVETITVDAPWLLHLRAHARTAEWMVRAATVVGMAAAAAAAVMGVVTVAGALPVPGTAAVGSAGNAAAGTLKGLADETVNAYAAASELDQLRHHGGDPDEARRIERPFSEPIAKPIAEALIRAARYGRMVQHRPGRDEYLWVCREEADRLDPSIAKEQDEQPILLAAPVL